MADGAKKAAKVIIGLLLIALGVYSYVWSNGAWFKDLLTLIKGGVGLFVIAIGFVFMLIGWTE